MTRLTNEISVLKFVRADRSSEFVVKKGDLLFQIDPRPFEEESARGQEVAQRLSDSAVPV